MHGVATVLTVDFVGRLRREALSPDAQLKLARIFTVGAGIFAVLFCLYLNTIPEGSRGNFFGMTTRIIAYVIGALGGLFVAAFLKLRTSGTMMVVSGFLGLSVGFYLSLGHWFQEHPDLFVFVKQGKEMIRWEPLKEEPNRIGSSAELSRFVLASQEVAPHHATIRLTEAGWQIERGTPEAMVRLNRKPVSQSVIVPDDVLDLGSHRLLIRLKAVSWMWPLPVAFLVTLLSAAAFSLGRGRRVECLNV